jgi:hypothetical protein
MVKIDNDDDYAHVDDDGSCIERDKDKETVIDTDKLDREQVAFSALNKILHSTLLIRLIVNSQTIGVIQCVQLSLVKHDSTHSRNFASGFNPNPSTCLTE